MQFHTNSDTSRLRRSSIGASFRTEIVISHLWLVGRPNEKDLDMIRTRKPEQPYIEAKMGDGTTRKLWCTFGPQQIDIDPFSVPGKALIDGTVCMRVSK